MDILDCAGQRRIVLALLLAGAAVAACGPRNKTSAQSFVGKWRSSKLATPLYLYDNGEWEIRTDEGGVLQYGVWEYRDDTIVWSFKQGSTITHDTNPVLSVSEREFRLKEGFTVTVFARLD